jgi:hypothetical protein
MVRKLRSKLFLDDEKTNLEIDPTVSILAIISNIARHKEDEFATSLKV